MTESDTAACIKPLGSDYSFYTGLTDRFNNPAIPPELAAILAAQRRPSRFKDSVGSTTAPSPVVSACNDSGGPPDPSTPADI